MRVESAAPLAPRTTIGLGGPAKRLAHVESDTELLEALADAKRAGERVLVLGGGSNLVVRDEGWDGLVIAIGTRGVEIERAGAGAGDDVRVSVAAGEPWDELVARTVEEGLAGLECLSGIPGLAGATPIQNVGAYGREVGDAIVEVRAFDRETERLVAIEPSACAFAYRSSRFKGSERWVVLAVDFRLKRTRESEKVTYAELARALGVSEGGRAPLARVREAVVALRRGKGMLVDPRDPESRSAGSFFTNPVLDPGELATLRARVSERVGPSAEVPCFAAPQGRTKVSAAWLIERAGFSKGHTVGRVGISRKHALALVNRGGATTGELLALADAIRAGVRASFGVTIEPEPVIV
jgi:UDP-N-acetylmuramate dehydrogenase